MWIKAFTRRPCKSIRLFEPIFSSSKTMPAYLQYGKELFASWSCHTPWLACWVPIHLQFDLSLDYLGWLVHDRIPSQLPHFPNWNTSWLNDDNAFHKGRGGVQPRAAFKHGQKANRKKVKTARTKINYPDSPNSTRSIVNFVFDS